MGKIAYEFQQRSANIAERYCRSLRRESIDSFPYHSIQIAEFDPSAVRNLLRFMIDHPPFITVLANNPPMKLDKREKWMGSMYSVFDTGGAVQLDAQIMIPPPNRFSPNNLQLINHETTGDVPVKIVDDPDATLYYMPDNVFKVPEVSLIINVKTPSIRPGNPDSIVLGNIYTR